MICGFIQLNWTILLFDYYMTSYLRWICDGTIHQHTKLLNIACIFTLSFILILWYNTIYMWEIWWKDIHWKWGNYRSNNSSSDVWQKTKKTVKSALGKIFHEQSHICSYVFNTVKRAPWTFDEVLNFCSLRLIEDTDFQQIELEA